MHNAPPVVYPVGRFVWGCILFVAVGVLSAVGLLSWQLQTLATGPKLWAAWLFWAICAGFAALWAPRQTLRGGRLAWSGEAWFLHADDEPAEQAQAVAVSVGVDTGQGLLLWLQPLNGEGHAHGRLLCAWLQARAMPSKWHGFRCAVYSRPKTPARLDKDLQERL